MPAKPRWLLRLPEILQTLEAWPDPWLDRTALETLFQLKRRRSIELLHVFGGFQVGRTFLADRASVIAQIRKIQQGDEFRWEQQRRRRVSESLTAARRYTQARQVRIPVTASPPAWPAGVELQAGRLIIAFRDVPDLLAKLYGLAQAAAGDFESFQAAVQHLVPSSVESLE